MAYDVLLFSDAVHKHCVPEQNRKATKLSFDLS